MTLEDPDACIQCGGECQHPSPEADRWRAVSGLLLLLLLATLVVLVAMVG